MNTSPKAVRFDDDNLGSVLPMAAPSPRRLPGFRVCCRPPRRSVRKLS